MIHFVKASQAQVPSRSPSVYYMLLNLALAYRLPSCTSGEQHANHLRKSCEHETQTRRVTGQRQPCVPWNSKSALRAFLASFFSHSSFSSMVHSQFFCRSTSSPRSSASALSRSVSASLRCFSSRTRSRAAVLAFEASSITEARFASVDDRCNLW